MANIPLRKLVLYKHGVGFFQREGQFEGSEIELTFRHDEINDILKSLAVFDRSGGQILGMQYQTPLDKATRLRDSSIILGDSTSLHDLLKRLRGRNVVLQLTDGTPLTGQLIGIDFDDEKPHESSLVSIRVSDDGHVRVVPISSLTGVDITDETAARDLRYFLDTSLSEDARRSVLLQLTEGQHDLMVYYVAPSPTWKVSYRMVIESDPNDRPGRGLLQGWGLFDNHLPEDLEQVSVTLVAGQPISFIYDLYSSHVPERPVVGDESLSAVGPIHFASSPKVLSRKLEMRSGGDIPGGSLDMVLAGAAAEAPEPDQPRYFRGLSREQAAEAVRPSAEAHESGELFQYVVSTPVNVRRGESALVPILGVEVKTQKELLYNPDKLPDHPVASIRFDNTTGLTLERGPVTVIEDGDYRGEAVVPFTKTDNAIHLAYAVERGIRGWVEHEANDEKHGFRFEQQYFFSEQYTIGETKVHLENTTGSDVVVTVEARISPGFELFDTPQPEVETAHERRWLVTVPAHDRAEFVWKHRRLYEYRREIRGLEYAEMKILYDGGWLKQEKFGQLSAMIERLEAVRKAKFERQELIEERTQIYEREKQLRENLGALQDKGDEAKLRSRVLSQLEGCEDRLAEIETKLLELAELIVNSEREVNEIIAGLSDEAAA